MWTSKRASERGVGIQRERGVEVAIGEVEAGGEGEAGLVQGVNPRLQVGEREAEFVGRLFVGRREAGEILLHDAQGVLEELPEVGLDEFFPLRIALRLGPVGGRAEEAGFGGGMAGGVGMLRDGAQEPGAKGIDFLQGHGLRVKAADVHVIKLGNKN